MKSRIRNFIFRTRLLSVVVPVVRIKIFFDYNLNNLKKSVTWLFSSREFTNFLYEITSLNRSQMIGGISSVTNLPIHEVEKYFIEIENDQQFRIDIDKKARQTPRYKELLFPIPFARRIVWYCLIRIKRPTTVVETGTEKGLGSLIIQKALDMNNHGKLYTLDLDKYAGSLLDLSDKEKISLIIGDSIQSISSIEAIDFFIHDSDHSAEHERKELESIETKLSVGAIVLSDNSHVTDELYNWSKKLRRKYIFIKEVPEHHWYGGAGVGISY
jgi:predicted O-methyltransferase YrrM